MSYFIQYNYGTAALFFQDISLQHAEAVTYHYGLILHCFYFLW